MRTFLLALCALAFGCPSGRADARRKAVTHAAPAASAAAAAVDRPQVVVFEGTCDASGAVPIDAHSFAVADDEDNVLRVYDAERGGLPRIAVDSSVELRVPIKKKGPKEADFEAATRIGDVALWLTSHGRNKKGKQKPERLRFFMTRLSNGRPLPGAEAYTALLDDMLADPRLRALGLADAATKPPQADGGLNIEGMTAMPNGQVLLGFRNPRPNGRALIVPLLNPLDPFRGKAARFGEPILLDLGGLSIRSLSYWRGSYLIAAGGYADGERSRVYRWAGPGHEPHALPELQIADFNPEAFFTPEERDEIMVLSDDGSREIDGERCKDLKDADAKRFRGLWLRPDADKQAAASVHGR